MEELLNQIEYWSGTYEFSFQFWGPFNNNVWIYKDGVELFDMGGLEDVEEVLQQSLDYIKRINKVK